RLDLPALLGGVGLVHADEVPGEEVGLLAALGAAYLEDHVLVVVRVLREEQHLEPPLEVGHRRLLLGHLLPGHLPQLGVALGAEHLLGVVELAAGAAQLPERLDDRLQLGVAPARRPLGVLVARGVDVGQARLEGVELALQVGQTLEHPANPNGRWGRPRQEPWLIRANGTKAKSPVNRLWLTRRCVSDSGHSAGSGKGRPLLMRHHPGFRRTGVTAVLAAVALTCVACSGGGSSQRGLVIGKSSTTTTALPGPTIVTDPSTTTTAEAPTTTAGHATGPVVAPSATGLPNGSPY